jgi:uncharacterized protein
MSETEAPRPGTIGWADLTVPDAEHVRTFYQEVAGWQAEALSMGEYSDYMMSPAAGGAPVAGVCHARGANATMPAQWMIYIVVDDLDASMTRCRDHGGEILVAPRGGGARYCVIRDPAGAVSALYQAAPAG